MSGLTAKQDNETTDYRIARQGKEQRAEGKALRECVLPGFPVGKNDHRAYGEVTGVIWLQTSCQPVGIFTKTMLLWNWPLVALPLY